MLLALVFITILFEILTDGVLLLPQNVSNLIQQNAYVIILAIGMTLCILTGGNIDLSVGSVVAFIGAISATLIVTNKMGVGMGIVIALAVGALIGVWQGAWIAYVRVPPFIATLAGMLIFRGLTTTVLQGLTISPFPKSYQNISSGFVPDIFAGMFGSSLNVTALVVALVGIIAYIIMEWGGRRNKIKNEIKVVSMPLFLLQILIVSAAVFALFYKLAQYKGVPNVLVLIAVLAIVYSFFTLRTVPGRYIYALGGNAKAAALSGINTKKVMFFVYLNMAFLAAVAGIVTSSRLNAAAPQAGQNFELDAIAACFIGGASATGGIGTIGGAIIGALIMGILNNGMSIMGLGTDMQMTIKGLVLMVAVGFDVLSKSRTMAKA